LRLGVHIPPRLYVIQSDAVDGLHHHQLPDSASMAMLSVP
jgi:hypothetical protein